MGLPSYHPFKSSAARDEYLALYDARAARWPLPSETRLVDTTYGQTFVRISGSPAAPALVLLTGSSASGLGYAPVIEVLSEHRRTYVVDSICDFGRSIWSRRTRTAEEHTQWLSELLSGLGLDRVDLLGVSYGGWMTAQMAIRRPERLRRTVWVAAGGVLNISAWWVARAIVSAVHPRLFRDFVDWTFADALKSPAGRRWLDEFIEEFQVGGRCFSRRNTVFTLAMTDAELRSVRVPSLFLVGEHDTIYSPTKAIARLKALAPHIKAEMMPGAGHDLLVVHARALSERVVAFLCDELAQA